MKILNKLALCALLVCMNAPTQADSDTSRRTTQSDIGGDREAVTQAELDEAIARAENEAAIASLRESVREIKKEKAQMYEITKQARDYAATHSRTVNAAHDRFLARMKLAAVESASRNELAAGYFAKAKAAHEQFLSAIN